MKSLRVFVFLLVLLSSIGVAVANMILMRGGGGSAPVASAPLCLLDMMPIVCAGGIN